jgi:uncharacterized membrane protein (Fun14 family)
MTQRLMFWAGVPLMAFAAMLALSGVSFGVGSGGIVVGTLIGDAQQYMAALTMFVIGLVLTSSATLFARRKISVPVLVPDVVPALLPNRAQDQQLMALALPERLSAVHLVSARPADAGGLSSLQRPSMKRSTAPVSVDVLLARVLDVESENERIRAHLHQAKATVSR